MSRADAEVARLLGGAAKIIEKARYCWLLTTAEAGGLAARPMGRLLHDPNEDEWTLRFVTDGRSRKASDMAPAGKVVLIFQHDPDDAYITLTGRAVLRREEFEVRRRWKAAYDAYFPSDLDRANAIFVEVRIESMELWIRGVTPEPFGLRATRLERDAGGAWQSVDGDSKAALTG